MGYRLWNADFTMPGEFVVSLDQHRFAFVPAVVCHRSAERLCYRCRNCKFGVRVFLGLRYVLHCVVYDSEGMDLGKEILAIMVRAHNEREPWIVVVAPLMICLLH